VIGSNEEVVNKDDLSEQTSAEGKGLFSGMAGFFFN
jgi:hypothetical protein